MANTKQVAIVWSGFTNIEKKMVMNLPRVNIAQKMEVVYAPSDLLLVKMGAHF